MRKTLTVERYHIYGTRGQYELVARHRGSTAFGRNDSHSEDSGCGLRKLLKLAQYDGFTHVKLVGEWSWWPDGMPGLGVYPLPALCWVCSTPMTDEPGKANTDCGGDCMSCMADAGDPDCLTAMEKLKEETET